MEGICTLSADRGVMQKSWFLTAGETDARGLMPVTLIVKRAIEIATEHANALGIGYADLIGHRMGWVLARITVEMNRYPGINETYSMETWIESYNRRFSDRCYAVYDSDGQVIGNIRSVWVTINMDTRALADLGEVALNDYPVIGRDCPVAKDKVLPIAADAQAESCVYTFKYCDIDFNRHVNTIRYLDLVLNLRSLDFYDSHDIVRLSASFEHECYFGETVTLLTGPAARDRESSVTEIRTPGGQRAVGVQLGFRNVRV